METWEIFKTLQEDSSAKFRHLENDDLVVFVNPYTEIIEYKQQSTDANLRFELDDRWVQVFEG